jgi:type VI secretion system secreted protein Hcp
MQHREKTAMPTVDYFLKIEGIPGESTDIKHPSEIAAEAWSFGESDPGADTGASGAGAGKVAFRDFHFAAAVSKASPRLIAACAEGQRLKSAVLTCRKSAGFQIEFLVLKFTDVRVTSYETGAAGSSEIMPVDHVALAFAKVEIDYTEQKPDGTATPPIQVTV